jgi:DNA-binding NarL/FixJ family response regulator
VPSPKEVTPAPAAAADSTEMEARSIHERSATSVVVCDDHPPIVDAVCRHLTQAGFTVVATAADGEAALAVVQEHRPSVCVADLRMPHLDGLELARRVAQVAPETSVLLYSGFSDRGLITQALHAGVRGVAIKDAPLDDLAQAIDTVAAGRLYVDPVLAAAFAIAQQEGEPKPLSERERDILRLLADGDSYAEIGATLYVSPDTVRAHARRAMTKLGARTRTQAVALALRGALIS